MIQITCRICKTIHEIEMTKEQMDLIVLGHDHIQAILPSPKYTADQRELFQSGFCGVYWDKLFPEDEEEDNLIDPFGNVALLNAMELSGDLEHHDRPLVQALSEGEVNEMLQDEYDYPYQVEDDDDDDNSFSEEDMIDYKYGLDHD